MDRSFHLPEELGPEPPMSEGDDCCTRTIAADEGAKPKLGTCDSGCCDEQLHSTNSKEMQASLKDTCVNDCCASGDETAAADERAKPNLGTCDSGCCDKQSPSTTSNKTQDFPKDICVDNCCNSSPDKSSTEPECCRSASSPCCDQQLPSTTSKEMQDSLKDICVDDCCNTNADQKSPEPGCCRGVPSPCCDESCLDRLAIRECGSESRDDCCKENPKSCPPVLSTGRKACNSHRQSIREQYAAKLEALGCICRTLLALGKESCCEPQKRSNQEKGKRCHRPSKEFLPRASVDSCCTSSSARQQSSCKKRVSRQQRNPACKSANKSKPDCGRDSCCDSTVDERQYNDATFSSSNFRKAGCNTSTSVPAGEACAEACCEAEKQCATPGQVEAIASRMNILETRSGGIEHVVLSISGMTCTGCETKLKRTLGTVAEIKNLKTSLVLSRAEFDVDPNQITVDSVMKHLERRTEFRCEVINNNGSTIDVVVARNASFVVNEALPEGVIDASVVDKNIVRVTFNPDIMGARDLIENHWRGFATLAPVHDDPGLAAGSRHVRHLGYMTLLSAVLTIPVLIMAWAPLPDREIVYSSASLALATLVQVAIAGPFYPKAFQALVFSRVIEMDLLIVLSTSAAYIFSVISFGYLVSKQSLPTGQFFETSTLLVTLIMVGRYVAALARQKAVESISIKSLQARTAILVDQTDPTKTEEVDVRLLQFGDKFKILPESRIPTDGTVLFGSSEVDESMLTGESLPVEKAAGSPVIAGTINGSGTLVVQLNRLPGDNTITSIAAMVDQAKLSKPKLQELADKVASYFVPVVISLTVVTFAIWVAIGVGIQKKNGSQAAVQAVTYAIAVLIVSCPCAIGLAVPMVVVITSGIAAERGVIFKSADSIEIAHKASHVVLDKTGTLTQGKLSVATEMSLGAVESLSLLLGMVGDSKHPVSVAVGNYLRNKSIPAAPMPDSKSLAGKGIEVEYDGKVLRAGNSRWLGVTEHPSVQPVLEKGQTVFCFTIDDELKMVFGLEDTIRPEASQAVKDLQRNGIEVHIVSGDDDGPVQKVALSLCVPACNTRSRSSPSDKQAYVKSLQDSGPSTKQQVVVFCGDGTNDAVALAQASIGVHMNEGSDVAQSAADVVLMRPDLAGILTMMKASKMSIQRIKFNFGWSFVYNTFAVLLAAGAFVNARIPPQFAGLGELVSVLPVIGAAVLLRWAQL
ncbi:hypothetical protein QQS21_000951 [Conoideocrella luteorostrata]|uniref:HMA domain-containing protein n=1 Tax=Conoideocrella luteorostrata TaxID=1105319 RepID=A0AAJ0CXY8_9HYPO|nr:hypothetical protein QQS21_000951 [Conoideocrella luteorostrata]